MPELSLIAYQVTWVSETRNRCFDTLRPKLGVCVCASTSTEHIAGQGAAQPALFLFSSLREKAVTGFFPVFVSRAATRS